MLGYTWLIVQQHLFYIEHRQQEKCVLLLRLKFILDANCAVEQSRRSRTLSLVAKDNAAYGKKALKRLLMAELTR